MLAYRLKFGAWIQTNEISNEKEWLLAHVLYVVSIGPYFHNTICLKYCLAYLLAAAAAQQQVEVERRRHGTTRYRGNVIQPSAPVAVEMKKLMTETSQ